MDMKGFLTLKTTNMKNLVSYYYNVVVNWFNYFQKIIAMQALLPGSLF